MAMYSMPIVAGLLAIVLFLGARTITRDAKKLEDWQATHH
jgi:hypothetical protein